MEAAASPAKVMGLKEGMKRKRNIGILRDDEESILESPDITQVLDDKGNEEKKGRKDGSILLESMNEYKWSYDNEPVFPMYIKGDRGQTAIIEYIDIRSASEVQVAGLPKGSPDFEKVMTEREGEFCVSCTDSSGFFYARWVSRGISYDYDCVPEANDVDYESKVEANDVSEGNVQKVINPFVPRSFRSSLGYPEIHPMM